MTAEYMTLGDKPNKRDSLLRERWTIDDHGKLWPDRPKPLTEDPQLITPEWIDENLKRDGGGPDATVVSTLRVSATDSLQAEVLPRR